MFQIMLPGSFSFFVWMFRMYNRNIETLTWSSELLFQMSRKLVEISKSFGRWKSLLLVCLQNVDVLGWSGKWCKIHSVKKIRICLCCTTSLHQLWDDKLSYDILQKGATLRVPFQEIVIWAKVPEKEKFITLF